MKLIKIVDLARLKRPQVEAFFSEVEALIKGIYGAETCREAVPFLEASQAYELTLKGCSLDEAAQLQALDDAADEAWGALNDQMKASLRHPNMDKRAAAAAVYMVFAEFSDPTRLNYDEEYEVIRAQLDDLRKLPKKTLELALIDEHVDALQRCYDQFIEILKFAQDGSKRPSLCKKTRAAVQDAYGQFVETINVMARINNDEKYTRIIDGINGIIEKMKLK